MTLDALQTQTVLGAFGLALKAGKCAVGTTQTVEKMRAGEGRLLAVASDLSDNTRKRLAQTAHTHGVPMLTLSVTKRDMAHRSGKSADTSSLLMLDEGFIRIIEKRGIDVRPQGTQTNMEVQR